MNFTIDMSENYTSDWYKHSSGVERLLRKNTFFIEWDNATGTLTNKTISGANNTLSNIDVGSLDGSDGTGTITLPALKGLLLRYGMAILTRQQTVAQKTAQINAATTIAQVQAIEIP
jgi:hypothetical protein